MHFREHFDVAVARAVAEMRVLGDDWIFIRIKFHSLGLLVLILVAFPAEYCLPLVRVGGLFVAAKGHSPEVCIYFSPFIHIFGASIGRKL